MTAPQTLTEKLIARAAQRDTVRPGDVVTVEVDLAMANDITAPLAIDALRRAGIERVWDADRVALVLSHFAPAKDVRAAVQCRVTRDFARRHRIRHFFDEGRGGIEHALLPERGLVSPGDVVIGADSHSCTYGALGAFSTGVGSTDLAAVLATGETWLRVPESIRVTLKGRPRPWVGAKDMILAVLGRLGVDGGTYRALEFDGEAVRELSIEGRLTLCNMAIEGGAKNGVVAADEVTRAYLAERTSRPGTYLTADPDARYERAIEVDCDELDVQIAHPASPDAVTSIEVAAGVRVDQVFIGSCTNARLEDLRVAASVLAGRSVARHTRCIVLPATQDVWAAASREGLLDTFARAGCAVGAPSCGPCLGGHQGVLAPDEVCVSTSNRNFPGRMGARDARVYLASPAAAAAAAVAGEIVHPEAIAAARPAPSHELPEPTHA